MATYVPESVLLNHVYVPFYQTPQNKLFNCSEHFPNFELGVNGLRSVIDLKLKDKEEYIYPFIDLKKFDPDTKSWYWYDSFDFPYSIASVNGNWVNLTPAWWDIRGYIGLTSLTMDPNALEYLEGGKGLGFYSSVYIISNTYEKFYTGAPIIVTINGKPVKDRTAYGEEADQSLLTNINPEDNMEFIYDSVSNKIYTNQNLDVYDPRAIEIYCYVVEKDVSVKCRMKANQGKDTYITPTVDYYVVKLNGQSLRG